MNRQLMLMGMTDLLAVPRPGVRDNSRPLRYRGDVNVSAAVGRRRRDCYAHPKSPSLASRQSGAVLSQQNFELCRQSLIRSILRCSDLQLFYLSALISSLLHCLRPLHRSEVVEIFRLVSPNNETCQEGSECFQAKFEQVQMKCENIFRMDSQGWVHLASPMLKQFLLTYPIRGVERSHFTLARACIAQVAADQQSHTNQSEQAGMQTSFSVYAAQNWHVHYRCVQMSSPGLAGQAHQILQTQILRRLQSTVDRLQQEVVVLGHAKRFCEATGLKVLCERYRQLLKETESEPFPQYPSRPSKGMEEAIAVVSKTLAQMTTEDSSEEDWILVS